jgi:peptidoglycan/LPS O-acetylase OafA/YrhL
MQSEIRAFTGVRGIAALYVVIYHFGLYYEFSGPVRTLLRHGYIAVDLFFILSGFVMALSYRELFAGGRHGRNMMVFLGKRVARIYPLYLVASAVAAGVVIWRGWETSSSEVRPAKLASNLFLVQSWGISGSYIGPAWSISAEWAAYLLFPLLCSVQLFRGRQATVVSVFLAFACLVLLAELPSDITHVVRAQGPLDLYDGTNYSAVLRCIPEFVLGIACFRAAQDPGVARYVAQPWIGSVLIVLIFALLAVGNSDIFLVPLLALLLLSVASGTNWLARLLGSPVFNWLGTISYSVYLFHTIVQAVATPPLTRTVEASGVPDGQAIVDLALLMIVLVTASLTYQLIEKPGRRSLQRLFANPRARGVLDPASTESRD